MNSLKVVDSMEALSNGLYIIHQSKASVQIFTQGRSENSEP